MNSHISHCKHYKIDIHLVNLRFNKFTITKTGF